jgi:ligand-binding sensor domain-containing protein/serine phosphatase RsbU (regulator of sigma subunit)
MRSYLHRIFATLAFVLFILNLNAQSPYFKDYTLFKNKKEYTVNSVFQDKSGFIWFGTSEGLVKFDGIDYEYYNTENGLPNNAVTAIAQDQFNKIWIGDKKGNILIFEKNSFTLFDPEEGLSSRPITDIMFDQNNNLWFATEGEGVYYFAGEIKRLYNLWSEEGISDHVYCIETDDKGNIWIGSDDGIAVFNQSFEKIHGISMKNGLPDNIVKHLVPHKTGMLLGMEEKGIAFYNLEKEEFEEHIILNEGNLNNFILNDQNELWISTQSEGLVRIRDFDSEPDYHYFKQKNGLKTNKINTVFEDRENNLWIASNGIVLQCNLNSFEFLNEKDGLFAENVFDLIISASDEYWLCTNQGIFMSKKNKMGELSFQPVLKNEFPNTSFISMYLDNEQYVWFGTYNEGVIRVNPKNLRYKQYKESDGLANNSIISISGNDSIVWFSSIGGGVSYSKLGKKNLEFNTINSQNGLKSDYIYQTFIDSEGKTWFAQDGSGITLLDNGRFINFGEEQGLHSNSIYGLTEAENNEIWMISSDKGIYNFDGKQFVNYSIQSGLATNFYSGICYIGNHELMLISNEGIEIFNTKSKNVRFYGEESGVAYLEPNLNACYNYKNENIWIGTNKGVIKYDLNNKSKDINPLISITKTQAFFNDIYEDSVVLNHNENHLTFKYSGFWFKAPDKLKYRHKLEGFDIDWIYTGNSKTQTYSNLPPGEYIFKAEVSHIQDRWVSSRQAEFHFEIKPPFWQTWWFISAGILFILFLIYTVFRLRLRKLKKDKEELEAEVKRRTQKILNQKEEIEAQKDEIEIQNEEIRESIHYAGRIQTALINTEFNTQGLTEYFTYLKPRDVVSGDFYWIRNYKDKQYYIAADCTGHGVPGAFMSMLGISFLDELILRREIETPAEILEELRKQVKLSLSQKGGFGEQKDGMDMAVVIIDENNLTVQYAGAYNPLYLFRNNELTEYKATRNPVGVYAKEIPFQNHKFELFKDDVLYIFSDGYYDQFGGESGQKYKSRNFKKLLADIHLKQMDEQKKLLEDELERWKNNYYSQLDDILIIGIKIKQNLLKNE